MAGKGPPLKKRPADDTPREPGRVTTAEPRGRCTVCHRVRRLDALWRVTGTTPEFLCRDNPDCRERLRGQRGQVELGFAELAPPDAGPSAA